MAFDWFKKKSQLDVDEKTRQIARRPAIIDFTESMVANVDLLRGLYHNTYSGLKLAGGLAYPAIAIPVHFMGLPIVRTVDDNKKDNEEIDKLLELLITDMKKVHVQSHRDGTAWIWPKIDTIKMRPMWEFIGDDCVTDIVKDIYTGNVIKIYTDEELTISTGYNETQNVRRIREFTDSKVTIRYEGALGIKGLDNKTFRNTMGIMPIPFANNTDGGVVRGHSDLERMISDLKIYHDTELAQHTAIAKFKPKMVQYVSNVEKWLYNNNFSPDGSDIDSSSIDLIFNLMGDDGKAIEKTEFIQLASIAAPYIDTKKQTFKKIVQESGVPEICWGLKTEGNNASVEESMTTLAQFVGDKQRQKMESYETLFNATLKLYSRLNMRSDFGEVKVKWNEMETVSAQIKSEIFKNFAEGISKVAGSATGTIPQLWKLWRENYPQITSEDEKDFTELIKRTSEHKQFTDADWDMARSSTGFSEDEDGAII